ncbi:MAG: histidine triad nucleotide-binding protein [Planctomycetota bacterium]
MTGCIFCEIASGKISAELIYEETDVVAFKDINPQAPHHILIVPRKHIETVNDITEEDDIVLGKMFLAAKKIAKSFGVQEVGYRLVINTNHAAGQAVFHIHLHLLAGRNFTWPPG